MNGGADIKYGAVYLDPPWDIGMTGLYKTRALRPASLVYPTLSQEELLELPIPNLMAENAHIWLWATNKTLPRAFDLLKAWGMKYMATVVWEKPSGLGNWWVIRNEFLLHGYIGKCVFKTRYLPTVVATPRAKAGEHSKKPEVFAQLVEQVSYGPYLEMFARRPRLGWDVWGNEVDSVELMGLGTTK